MKSYLHLRASSHELGTLPFIPDETLDAPPSQLVAILLFAIPMALTIIMVLTLFRQVRRVINNYFIRTAPAVGWVLVIRMISFVGLITIGIYQIIQN